MLKWYRVGIVYRVAVKNLKKKHFLSVNPDNMLKNLKFAALAFT